MMPVGVVVRRVLSDKLLTIVSTVVLVVLGCSAAVVPGQARRSLDADLRQALVGAPELSRTVQVTRPELNDPTAAAGAATATEARPMTAEGLRAQGEAVAADLDPAVAAVLGDPKAAVSSIVLIAPSPPGRVHRITLRVDPGLEEQVGVVAGRRPGPGAPAGTIEVAVSAQTAEELQVDVGDTVALTPDASNPYVRRYGPPASLFESDPYVQVHIVGIIRPDDPQAVTGAARQGVLTPFLESSPDGSNLTVNATVLVGGDALDGFALGLASSVLLRTWSFDVAAQALRADQVDQLVDALARQAQQFPDFSFVALGDTGVRTALDLVLADAAARRAAAGAVLTAVAASTAAVAMTLLVALGLSRADAARSERALLRARGAPGRVLLAAAVLEAMLVAAPAMLVAAGVALGSGSGVVGIWVALAVPLVGAGALLATRDAGGPTTAVLLGHRTAAIIGALGLAGIAAAAVLRQPAGGGTDPLAAAAPALVAVACALVIGRIVPVGIRLASPLAGRTRGVVAGVSLRAVGRRPGIGIGIVAVLVATATTTQLAAVAAVGVRAPYEASLARVGADVRIDGFVPSQTAAERAGVQASAQAQLATRQVAVGGQVIGEVVVLALDVPAWAAVVVEGPLAASVPDLTVSAAGIVPAIGSSGSAGGPNLSAGTAATIGGVDVGIQETRSGFPSLPEGQPFVVVPLASWSAAGGPAGEPRTYARTDDPDLAADALTPVGTDGAGTVQTRTQVERSLIGRPVTLATGEAIRLGAGLAVVLAALAVLTTAARAVRGRRGELAPLLAIGATPREVVVILAMELLAGVVIGAAAGVVVGTATIELLGAGVDLRGLTGTDSVTLRSTPAVGLAVGGALAVLSAAASVAVAGRQRRDVAQALRSDL